MLAGGALLYHNNRRVKKTSTLTTLRIENSSVVLYNSLSKVIDPCFLVSSIGAEHGYLFIQNTAQPGARPGAHDGGDDVGDIMSKLRRMPSD